MPLRYLCITPFKVYKVCAITLQKDLLLRNRRLLLDYIKGDVFKYESIITIGNSLTNANP